MQQTETDVIRSTAREIWVHRGLFCATRLGVIGNLNGYVRLPESHPYRHLDYTDIGVDCPGGLTYGADDYGWVGFDTNHYNDRWSAAEVEGFLADAERKEVPGANGETEIGHIRRTRSIYDAEGLFTDPAVNDYAWTESALRRAVEALADSLVDIGK